MTARDRWTASGLVAFRLPSGFIVRGVYPSLTELTRIGMVPWGLRKAILDHMGKKFDELTAEQVKQNMEQRLRIAAGFVQGIYDDEAGEWETLRLTFDEYTALPGEDVEALDKFVILASNESPALAAEAVNAASEFALGLVDEQEPEPEEAGDTVDAFAEFRDGDGGDDGYAVGADVGPTPIDAARHQRSDAGVSRGRRPRAKTAPRAAAG